MPKLLRVACNGIRNCRRLSSQSLNIFNYRIKRIQRERAFARHDAHLFEYLKEEVAFRMEDRIYDVKRRLPVILDLESYKGQVTVNLTNETVDKIIYASTSQQCLDKIANRSDIQTEKLLMDDEETLNIEPNSLDLVITNLHLHWVNDLPKLFANVMQSLKEDGIFIGSMFGGQTLFELRCSLQMAETEREGGCGLHVSPFITPQDIGGLLNRAGFTLLTIDTDEFVIHYPSMFELMHDLKGMAENNAMLRGRTHINRDSLLAASAIYSGLYGMKPEQFKKVPSLASIEQAAAVPATFQTFYFIGWKPHPSQPQPLKRGSANFSLKDIANLGKQKVNKKE